LFAGCGGLDWRGNVADAAAARQIILDVWMSPLMSLKLKELEVKK